jgi:predicted O-methyltransferase YrrM
MTQERWTAVDDYLTGALLPSDAAIDDALTASDTAGLPREAVSPTQGKLLHLLARSVGAKNILEIGTLGGYSTIWLARALPTNGRLVTLEANATHAEVARSNVTNAGLADIVTLHQGPALDSLATLVKQDAEPFDLIFIDADKPNNPAYLEWALKLSRPGTLIIGDNVVRDGAVADPTSADPKVQGVRRFIELIAENPRLDATAIQTVGSKGYDGFVLALVN